MDHTSDAKNIQSDSVNLELASPAATGLSGLDPQNDEETEDTKPVVEQEKSVQRLNKYKTVEKLNKDQKATISRPPVPKSLIKELEGVRKTLETPALLRLPRKSWPPSCNTRSQFICASHSDWGIFMAAELTLEPDHEPEAKPKPESDVIVATNLGIPIPTTIGGGGWI
ncbi:hypothetical protein FRC07_006168 [Ceratobasidium sp. 392]|nr:hypothetical protein FRC07_006168 [Ceratobasidium sp. 392]